MRRGACLALLGLAAGCARPLPAPPPDLRGIAVLAPANRTGGALVVAGDWFLERLALGGGRVTVPDVLGAEIRAALAANGFDVVAVADAAAASEAAAALARGHGLDAPVLYTAIERWEPEEPLREWVNVTLSAGLVDPNGRVRWQTRRAAWLVPVRGAPTEDRKSVV